MFALVTKRVCYQRVTCKENGESPLWTLRENLRAEPRCSRNLRQAPGERLREYLYSFYHRPSFMVITTAMNDSGANFDTFYIICVKNLCREEILYAMLVFYIYVWYYFHAREKDFNKAVFVTLFFMCSGLSYQGCGSGRKRVFW